MNIINSFRSDPIPLCQQGIECDCQLGVHAWRAIPPGPNLHMAVDKNGVAWVIRASGRDDPRKRTIDGRVVDRKTGEP